MRLALALLLFWSVGASAVTLPEFYIHLQGKRQAGMLVWQDTRQWVSEWVGYANGDVEWLDPNTGQRGSVEHQIFRDGFFVITGFDQWPADCTKAEIEDINTGTVYPLTCSKGHFYSPLIVPKDPWRIRVWGLIAGNRKFYWQSDFFPGETVTNPCWFQGPITREVIRQKDSWWDEVQGWVRATGSLPFEGNKPVRPTVQSLWEVTVAKGLGVFTTKGADGRVACLYSVWSWE